MPRISQAKAEPKPIRKKAEPPTDLELKVAEYINNNICFIPGCIASMHVEDAHNLIELIKKAE